MSTLETWLGKTRSPLGNIRYNTTAELKAFTRITGFKWHINSLAISGEKSSSNALASEEFVPHIIKDYCDETGLFYKMLSIFIKCYRTSKTVYTALYGTKTRKTDSRCLSKASDTIKILLFLISKAKHRRCYYSGIIRSTMPVVYKNQTNTWVDTSTFKDWFNHHLIFHS